MQPVIIVGAGPTGLALALALARRNVPTTVLDSGDGSVPERAARTCVLPPDTAHWARLPGARDEALPWTAWRSTHRGKPREHLAFPPEAAPVHLPVHTLERALRAAAAQEDLIRVVTGRRVTGIDQRPRGVTARCALTSPGAGAGDGVDGDDGDEHHGSHLVGCDGARSTVRKLLDVSFPGRTSVARYAVAAVHAELPRPGEASLHRRLPGRRGRPGPEEVWLRPLTGDRWRLDWPLPSGDDSLVTPDALLERLHRSLGAWQGTTQPHYDLLDTGVYHCHQRLARQWRQGRVLLAGDAAHLLGALGTQQVSEGLRDADTLAWKLVAVRRRIGADALLDSYARERRGAVGARLRAVDQALPLVRGSRLGRLVPGRERARRALLSDASLGRGALGGAGVYDVPRAGRSVPVATEPGAPVADVPVTGLDGSRHQLSDRLGGAVLLVLTAPGAGVWEPRHWLSAGLMPHLAETVRRLPLDTELLVTEGYPGAPAHTVLVIRPDGRLAAALPGAEAGDLRGCVRLLHIPLPEDTAAPAPSG